MIEKIVKRDGRVVPFDKTKIIEAIWKAAQAVGGKDKQKAYQLTDKVVELLEKKLKPGEIPTVEQVQDVVEKVLVEEGHYKTAKAYILYRALHTQIRELVDGYLQKVPDIVRDNANSTFSLQALNFYISSQVIAQYWLHKIFKPKPEIRDAHINGDFHIHNLAILGPYCVGWDLRDLLLVGFKGVRGKIDCRPAKHFRSALGQVVNFLYSLQGEAAGAQAFSNFDTYLAPFIRYDNLDYSAVKQALQEFMFNINVPTRVGYQTPFTNITLDLKVPEFMKNEPVIISGKFMKETYGDFQEEMDTFNKALAEVMLEGDASGRVFSFPIPTINITKDFDWENEAVRKIFETSAKYGIPYFANFINSDMKPEDVRSMCLHPSEEVIIKNEETIHRIKIGELAKEYANEFDGEGWATPRKNVKILSINPNTLETEWQPVRYFLRRKSKELVKVTTEDGKVVKVTTNHPFLILTPKGFVVKFAKDLKVGDIALSLRSAREALNRNYMQIPVCKKRKFKLLSEELEYLHNLGLSDKQISHIANLHVDTVRRKRRELKLKPNPHSSIGEERLFKLKSELEKRLGRVEKITLDEKMAAFLGFFTADGNYLFENRKDLKTYSLPRGIQLTLNYKNKKLKKVLKHLIKDIFGIVPREKKDPRYNTFYLYIYNCSLARALYQAGFRKYGRLPPILFNSPPSVIKSFLNYFFLGDGYESRGEIHINDEKLARDIAILYSLVGIPTCIKLKKNYQRIYLQHKTTRHLISSPLYELVPAWTAKSNLLPGLKENQMVGVKRLEKYDALTEVAKLLAFKAVAPVRIKDVEKVKLSTPIFFYDFELNSNHIFVHSLGTITHNCCRLRLELRELRKRGGGFFGANPLTGSIGVVTINLPRIGFLSKDEADFFERLERLMVLAKDELEIKRQWLEKYTEIGLYPYSKFYLRNIKQEFGEYWKNHFNTIGLVGMNEACLNFLGCTIAEKKGHEFAIKVLDFMREKLADFQIETGNIYNLEATPAEGSSYRLAKIDKEKYPEIIVANNEAVKKGAAPFYTGSSFLPVDFTDDIWWTLKHQDPLQIRYTGGCIEKGNKVLTDKGQLNIEYIVENFSKLRPLKVISYNPEKGIAEWDEVVNAVKIDVSKNNKIKVRCEKNLEIVTSDWHPFFVLEKIKPNPICPICGRKAKNIKSFATHLRWSLKCRRKYKNMSKYRVIEKRADELKKNDYILQNSFNLYPNKKSELNNELMWLVGFFIGDGSISEIIDNRGGNNLKKYLVRFFSGDEEPLKKAKKILTKYFGCNANLIQNDKKSKVLKEISTSKKKVATFFLKLGFDAGKKVYDVNIPKKVKENINRKNVFALISGLLDSDGTIGKRDGAIEYFTVSPNLADDILEICSCAGIMISKSRKITKRKNEINGWRLMIPSYEATRIKNKLEITKNILRIKEEVSNRRKRHLPVTRVKETSKVDVEDNQFFDLTTKNNHNYLAGKNSLVFVHNTVLHIWSGEANPPVDSVIALVKKIFNNFRLPYITFTPTFSICSSHGYIPGRHELCPKCEAEGKRTECEVFSRIVGYLRPVENWNPGKQEEFKLRKTFDRTVFH